ncbi:aminodeoxychorismate synthase component I, partial [Candidatus Pelagibacter sp.]|nr:aminodeoxychorismate synthase component I [Candidatus Pelagibacter sp.]
MNNINKLYKLHNSNQPYIIYKSNNGFKLYFDFSKKIILKSKRDIENFLNFKTNKKKSKNTDLFIGFFGYELLNNLIGIKLPKQNSLNFY